MNRATEKIERILKTQKVFRLVCKCSKVTSILEKLKLRITDVVRWCHEWNSYRRTVQNSGQQTHAGGQGLGPVLRE